MKNISDVIEKYLKTIIARSKDGYIEIQRSELAEQFQCVPSQINYVINTRFTVEKGYLVESKRGGGGFIRIRKITFIGEQELLRTILDMIDDEITQKTAEAIIQRMFESKLVTEREARMMNAVIQRNVLAFEIPVRDKLRAKILRSALISLMYE